MPRLANGAPVVQRVGQRYLKVDERDMFIRAVETRPKDVMKEDVVKE